MRSCREVPGALVQACGAQVNMPLRRSPPQVATSSEALISPCHGGSEPSIPTCDRDEIVLSDYSTNVTTRIHKRRYDQEYKAEWQSFKTEIMTTLKTWSDSQNNKIDQILTSVNEIREEYRELCKSVEFNSEKFDDIIASVAKLENERRVNLKYIESLENKLESVERSLKSSTIEIRNIPLNDTKETTEDLINVIKNVGKTVSVDVKTTGIRDIFRVNNKTDGYKPIIVEFTSKLTKDSMLAAVKKFNLVNKDSKLNTSHLQLKGPQTPIYVTETLTSNAKKLFYLCRQFAKEYKYTFCWVTHGRIFLRKAEGQKQIRIDSESDLTNLRVKQ